MKEAQLPAVFAKYVDIVHYVRQVTNVEFCSSCPECGGSVHDDGEWPDRMRWRTDGKPRGFCRRCGTIFWPDDNYVFDPAVEAKWQKEQTERELARKRSAERALKNLEDNRIFEQYHKQLDATRRRIWRDRGIPDSLQDFWMLGYCKQRSFWSDGQEFHSDTITIPIFGPQWAPLNIKHRLLQPAKENDKYRPEFSGFPQPLMLTDPDADLDGAMVAVEGEIKSCVVAITLGTALGTVVGMPGMTPGKHITDQLAKAERLTIIVDPGGRRAAWEICKAVDPKKCHVLVPTERMGKIDDYIIKYAPTSDELRWMIRQEAKPAW
jgi:hypothetical protein